MAKWSGVSGEAPVLILKDDTTEMLAGGAGNAANNVAALGGRARLAGYCRRTMLRDCRSNDVLWPHRVDRGNMLARPGVIERPSRHVSSPEASIRQKQQLVRIDRETCLVRFQVREPETEREAAVGSYGL